jgi:hypothetical protein
MTIEQEEEGLAKDGKKVIEILNQMETEFDKELGLQLYTLGFTAGRRYGDIDLQ